MIGLLTIAGIIACALKKKKGVGTPAWISGVSGLKHYYIQYGVGKAKYIVNYTDGWKRHRDGSLFFDIAIFNNKKDLEKFTKQLKRDGYVETYSRLNDITSLERWFLNDIEQIFLEENSNGIVYADIYHNDGTADHLSIDYETAEYLIDQYNAMWRE